ncbi:FAD-binding protein [Nocardia sp. CA2R105]|uniref:FAD-dependent oxidoreductase n=1 Tax=Nocardia coffeae TaxID=2873381 RepID=UPI001CA74B72|nr:FAD-binding protein [Nocardia coffeae]MBY8862604.1 FAD-binding protein [Nocardia coffeae]
MIDLEADVLVLGGGPAGVWAALAAARAGVRVVLVDKARCGHSGPTAKGFVSLWNIPPGPLRDAAVQRGLADGGCLGDPEWMARMLAETHRHAGRLARWGRRDPGERAARATRVRLDGAQYLARMRRALVLAGVRILDHHPALQLVVDTEGVVSGAAGVALHEGFRSWSVRAGSVVLATGGCAFRSGGAGTDVDTGDGMLMAAEVGGELSGMEFSSAYSLAPVLGPHPAGAERRAVAARAALRTATLCDESGTVFGSAGEGFGAQALTALADGRRVYACWEADPRDAVPGRRVSGDLARMPVRAVLEGTVRGAGGVHLIGFDCATTVPGLFAAGEVAGREPITGAVGGFGGQGGGWAMSSGAWAGAGAARFATGRGRRGPVRLVPGAGLHGGSGLDPRAVIGLVQEHTLPMRRSYRRSADSLRNSIAELDALWPATEFALGGSGADRLHAREAAALLAVARWTKYSALARTESRGIHRRTDHPQIVDHWCRRLLSGGVSTVWVRPQACEPVVPVPQPQAEPVSQLEPTDLATA